MPPSATIGVSFASRSSKRLMRLVDGAAFHPAGDRNELAGHVAGELVGGEHHDGARHVLGLRDLAQRHRPAEAVDEVRVELAARHRGVRPARSDGVDAAAGRDPHDLVLQAQQQAALDRGLRRRVVGMSGLSEAPGGRADQDEVAVAVALDDPQEPARSEERRREVRAQRRVPALERKLPDGFVLARPESGDRRADVDAAERPHRSLEQRVDLASTVRSRLQRDAAGLRASSSARSALVR